MGAATGHAGDEVAPGLPRFCSETTAIKLGDLEVELVIPAGFLVKFNRTPADYKYQMIVHSQDERGPIVSNCSVILLDGLWYLVGRNGPGIFTEGSMSNTCVALIRSRISLLVWRGEILQGINVS